MSIRPILIWPAPELSRVCAPVGEITDDVRSFADDLLATMYDAKGRGLAASQLGVLKRIFVMDVTWKEGAPDPKVFVDPEIDWADRTTQANTEGCLSIPGVLAEVLRARAVRVLWTGLDGDAHCETFEGAAAYCIQHEVDHLDGRVTLDRLDKEARAKVVASFKGVLG